MQGHKALDLALFLSPPETLPAFFSLPCPQTRFTKTSGMSTFQNTLQENKRSKMKKNDAQQQQQQAVGLAGRRRLWGCALGRHPNALSWLLPPPSAPLPAPAAAPRTWRGSATILLCSLSPGHIHLVASLIIYICAFSKPSCSTLWPL